MRVLYVEDNAMNRQVVKDMLDVAGATMVEAPDAESGLRTVDEEQFDIVLMDIRMPIMDGIAAIRILQQQAPQIKILVLTTFDEDEYIVRAINHGAQGYLLKDTPSAELAQAIRSVNQGYSQMSPGLLAKAMANFNSVNSQSRTLSPKLEDLTTREKEVLKLIATGYSNKEIAAELYITERTVKNHVNHILRSLDLRDRTQAALFAYEYFKQ